MGIDAQPPLRRRAGRQEARRGVYELPQRLLSGRP